MASGSAMQLKCWNIAGIRALPETDNNSYPNIKMTLKKKIAAIILISIACIPCMAIFNDGPSALPNIIGIIYLFLLYKYGKRIAPKCVKEYDEYLDEKDEEMDEEWD